MSEPMRNSSARAVFVRLAPYVNASGELVMEAPDPDVMLFKQGLDLRLKEPLLLCYFYLLLEK